MERIKDTLQNVFRDIETVRGQKHKSDPAASFKKLLTKKEQAHIKITNLHKGILYVNVDSSSWLYVFTLRKSRYLDKLKPAVTDVRFRIGDIAL